MGEKRFSPAIRKKMEKAKNDKPSPGNEHHSGDKKTRFWALNNTFLNKSSNKDPNPNKQQK
jgi:hypothetical protein